NGSLLDCAGHPAAFRRCGNIECSNQSRVFGGGVGYVQCGYTPHELVIEPPVKLWSLIRDIVRCAASEVVVHEESVHNPGGTTTRGSSFNCPVVGCGRACL